MRRRSETRPRSKTMLRDWPHHVEVRRPDWWGRRILQVEAWLLANARDSQHFDSFDDRRRPTLVFCFRTAEAAAAFKAWIEPKLVEWDDIERTLGHAPRRHAP